MGHEKTNGEFAFAHYSEKVKRKNLKNKKGSSFPLLSYFLREMLKFKYPSLEVNNFSFSGVQF